MTDEKYKVRIKFFLFAFSLTNWLSLLSLKAELILSIRLRDDKRFCSSFCAEINKSTRHCWQIYMVGHKLEHFKSVQLMYMMTRKVFYTTCLKINATLFMLVTTSFGFLCFLWRPSLEMS